MQVSPNRNNPVPCGDVLVYFSRSNVLRVHGDGQMMSERPCRSGQSVRIYGLHPVLDCGHRSPVTGHCFMAPTTMKTWGSFSWMKCLWDSDGEDD
jgi:hypothetical protein